DCNKIMNSMIEMVKKENPEKTEEIERNREIIFHLYMIECESGKFDLNCLANIKLLSELDNCKRKQ
ncbi:MAG TPA: TIGR04454 family lipoprotein, partial [Leptospiraceae bacterium]|nr:TIGR04454 family lipoprotein [Leptospiraceae bacterium]